MFAVDSKSTITDFTLGKVYPVMIIGYEKVKHSSLTATHFQGVATHVLTLLPTLALYRAGSVASCGQFKMS